MRYSPFETKLTLLSLGIVTRSRSKQCKSKYGDSLGNKLLCCIGAHVLTPILFLAPDQYTTTQVPIKIVKLLVSELNNAPNAENAGGEEYAESGDEAS
jgi:hypothetical protein